MRTTKHSSLAMLLLAIPAALMAQSNIDNTVPDKFGWGENVGWANWRDANGGANGVLVSGSFMSGYIWFENLGWVNVGDGTPGSSCGGLPCYANATGADFGINIDPDGDLHGLAWGENVGWINFDGGALATPAQPARIVCASPPGQPLARLTGYAWGENIGWLNLSDLSAGKFVAVDAATTPILCDVNHDGMKNGLDVQYFVNKLLLGTGDWRDLCSGDVESSPDRMIDLDDALPFVNCLLSAP